MHYARYTVDIVIPVMFSEERNILERLLWRSSYRIPDNFSITVVDCGSPMDQAQEIERFCHQNSMNYIQCRGRDGVWNASMARNKGIEHSSADYLLFEDVDLISHIDFYKWINIQIQSLIIDGNWEFFAIPVSYLSAYGSEFALNGAIDDYKYGFLTTEIFNGNSDIIEFHAQASSFLLCSRRLALDVGGYDEAFEGWGFEDSDFWFRLLKKTSLEKPKEFAKLNTSDYRNQVEWKGWRALFRIYADLMAYKGIYGFHIWHEPSKHKHKNDPIRAKNRRILEAKSRILADDPYELVPMWLSSRPSQLFLNRNPHSFNDALFRFFDNPLLIEESDVSLESIGDIVNKYNIETVIFNNPYGNNHRLSLYNQFRSLGIPCYVVERGALPWSIYIDPNGFCAESTSYQEENWQSIFMDDVKKQDVASYISAIKETRDTLEPQGKDIGGDNLRRKLFGHLRKNKILLAAFQSPSDTTTRFFCGDVGSYDNFVQEVRTIAATLPRGWVLVYKNHPLTIEKSIIDGAICVDDFHINDILEVCDAITVINSGIGILALIYNKPVYYFGQVFYACNGLNVKVNNASDLVENLSGGNHSFDIEKRDKFLWYLIKKFYSFAQWERAERNYTEKAKLSISKNIRYREVRIIGKGEYFPRYNDNILRESLLFDRYRFAYYVSRPNNAALKKPGLTVIKSTDTLNSPIFRKIRKLVMNPKSFFRDAVLKRLG